MEVGHSVFGVFELRALLPFAFLAGEAFSMYEILRVVSAEASQGSLRFDCLLFVAADEARWRAVAGFSEKGDRGGARG